MTEFETVFLYGVIVAFLAFSATLAWASATSGGRPKERDSSDHGDD